MKNRAAKKFLTWFVLIVITIALVYWLIGFVTGAKDHVSELQTEREEREAEQRTWYEDADE